MIGKNTKISTTARLLWRFCVIGLPVYLLVSFGLIEVYREHRKTGLEAELAAEVAAMTAALAQSILPLLSSENRDGVRSLLQVAAGTRAMRCVEVVFEGEVGEEPLRWPGFPCLSHSKFDQATVPIRNGSVILGQVVSQFSTEWAGQKLTQESRFLYWAIAIGALAAFTAFALAYRMVVDRRIKALCVAIRHRQTTGEDRLVSVDGRDPLSEVAKAYNAMLRSAQVQADAVKEARSKQADLEQKAARTLAENEARTRFLEAASHELRTPLNGIMGASEILAGTSMTAKQRRGSLLLRDASDRLEATISQILKEADRSNQSPHDQGTRLFWEKAGEREPLFDKTTQPDRQNECA